MMGMHWFTHPVDCDRGKTFCNTSGLCPINPVKIGGGIGVVVVVVFNK